MLGPALATLAYLVGSLSPALLWARAAGVDLRGEGSGNPGASNAARVLGKRVGVTILLLDMAKGAIPALVASRLLGTTDPWTATVGAVSVLGHCFPLWHRFQGGKGAATGLGVMLVLDWPAGLASLVTAGLVRFGARIASAGSLAGAAVGGAVAWYRHGATPIGWMAVAILLIIVARHAGNIERLSRGAEPPT